MLYVDTDDFDLAFFIASKKMEVSDQFKALSIMAHMPSSDMEKTINAEVFWSKLALFIANFENPRTAQKATDQLIGQWIKDGDICLSRGLLLVDKNFLTNRVNEGFLATNFFERLDDLLRDCYKTHQIIEKRNKSDDPSAFKNYGLA